MAGNPNGRMQFVSGHNLPAPGICACCGGHGKDSVIWGKFVQFEGAVMLCMDCLREASTWLPEEVDEEKIHALQQLALMDKVLEEYRDGIDNITKRFRNRLRYVDISTNTSVEAEPEPISIKQAAPDEPGKFFRKTG